MHIVDTALESVKILEPRVFGDERGFFLESWNREAFERVGLPGHFVQDNHSRSACGVLRGLHYQLYRPQGKLVRVTQGAVFDVAVDLRAGSQAFGCWTGAILSAENRRQLWVPPGFAHGFLVLTESADFQYKCTEYYAPEHERSLLWNDVSLAIEWPKLPMGEPLLSDKDKAAPSLADADVYAPGFDVDELSPLRRAA